MISPITYQFSTRSENAVLFTRPLPGWHWVGVRHYLAEIPSRVDIQTDRPRRFMLTAFYPAMPQSDLHCGMFLDLFEPSITEALEYLTGGLEAPAKTTLLASLPTIGMRSLRGAVPKTSDHPYPVLIYYPAGGSNRFGNVDVCEGLASKGYVVLALDSPHDSEVAVFPDGSLSKGPLKGDYITPGVTDVAFLLGELNTINADIAGVLDANRVGIFGHSRGGYISNIAAFQNDRILAGASIDSFVWGYSSKQSGLERHSKEFQSKVRTTPKPLLRLCGRPAETNPLDEAKYCISRDGGDFIGPFYVVACTGWQHGVFRTTPWLCGKGEKLVANLPGEPNRTGEMLTGPLAGFFNSVLRGSDIESLESAVARYHEIGMVSRNTLVAL